MKKRLLKLLLVILVIGISIRGYELYQLKVAIDSSGLIFHPIHAKEITVKTKIDKAIPITTVNAFSLTAEVPVPLVQDAIPVEEKPDMAQYTTKEGMDSKTLTIHNLSSQESVVDTFLEKIGQQEVVSLFGSNTIESDFKLRSFLYSIDPNTVNFFSKPSEFKIAMIAMIYRSMDTGYNPEIYAFKLHSELNGLQIGTPENNPMVYVELHKKKAIYSLTFTDFTQDEIDLTLASIRLSKTDLH